MKLELLYNEMIFENSEIQNVFPNYENISYITKSLHMKSQRNITKNLYIKKVSSYREAIIFFTLWFNSDSNSAFKTNAVMVIPLVTPP